MARSPSYWPDREWDDPSVSLEDARQQFLHCISANHLGYTESDMPNGDAYAVHVIGMTAPLGYRDSTSAGQMADLFDMENEVLASRTAEFACQQFIHVIRPGDVSLLAPQRRAYQEGRAHVLAWQSRKVPIQDRLGALVRNGASNCTFCDDCPGHGSMDLFWCLARDNYQQVYGLDFEGTPHPSACSVAISDEFGFVFVGVFLLHPDAQNRDRNVAQLRRLVLDSPDARLGFVDEGPEQPSDVSRLADLLGLAADHELRRNYGSFGLVALTTRFRGVGSQMRPGLASMLSQLGILCYKANGADYEFWDSFPTRLEREDVLYTACDAVGALVVLRLADHLELPYVPPTLLHVHGDSSSTIRQPSKHPTCALQELLANHDAKRFVRAVREEGAIFSGRGRIELELRFLDLPTAMHTRRVFRQLASDESAATNTTYAVGPDTSFGDSIVVKFSLESLPRTSKKELNRKLARFVLTGLLQLSFYRATIQKIGYFEEGSAA